MSLAKMPSNVINVQKMEKPATEPRFKVIEEGNPKPLHTSPTAWHSYDKAYQLMKQGKKVNVVVWDPFVGAHVPTSQATGYDELNEHGEVKGNWRQVVEGRASRKSGQKVNHTGIAIDDELVRILGNMSTVAKSSAGSVRTGKMTNKDLYIIREMFGMVVEYLDQKIDDSDPELKDIGEIVL
jgi:hypothetical protein